MKFFCTAPLAFLVALVSAAPLFEPFVLVSHVDGTSSLVGGSSGCFGTSGEVNQVSVAPGYQATLYSDYSCKGTIFIRARGQVHFNDPYNVKSIELERVLY
jgi:hypothetical protein